MHVIAYIVSLYTRLAELELPSLPETSHSTHPDHPDASIQLCFAARRLIYLRKKIAASFQRGPIASRFQNLKFRSVRQKILLGHDFTVDFPTHTIQLTFSPLKRTC